MNDLLEKALDGVGVAYDAARSRALVTVATIGLALGAVIVVAAGRVGAARATRPLTTWFGLQDTHDIEAGDPVPGAVLLAATVALLLLWVVTLEVIRRRRYAARGVWGVFAAWAAPFVLGPPLFDPSVYSYVAFGLVQRAGHDPYDTPPSGLGYARIVEAVDPGSRAVVSAAGPLGTLGQHLVASVGVGNALLMVIVLRAVALVATVWIGRAAVELASGGRREPAGTALALTVLNPLLLFYVVSACRLEGVAAALALTAVVAAARRSWTRAMLLASAAGAVLAPALLIVPALIAAHLALRRRRNPWRLLARDVAAAAVPVAVFGLIVDDGFGWIHTARDQFATHTPFSVADATGRLLAPIVRDASYDTLTASTRLATVIAMAAVIVALLVTGAQRRVDATVGCVMLAAGLLAPTLYPWFLIVGVVCLAPRTSRTGGVWLAGVCAAGCLLMPGGFDERATDVLTGASLLLVAVATAGALRAVRPASAAGDVADGGAHVGEVHRDHDERDQ